MKLFLLIMITFNVTVLADFNRNEVGIVMDSNTGLQWQDNYSDNGDSIKLVNWEEAIAYCEALNLDGGGWRLPNIRELNSIIDFTKSYPAINPIFQFTDEGYYYYYWSSTTFSNSPDSAWGIKFYYGDRDPRAKEDPDFVRCVRQNNE